MKRTFVTTALLLACVTARAQGVVNFANIGAGVNAPVTNLLTGQAVSGPDYWAALYSGPTNALEAVLTGLGDPVPLSFGYFFGGPVTNLLVVPPSFVGSFQVRAWSGAFDSYEDAYAAAQTNFNILIGKSALFQNATALDAPGASLTGLRSFGISPIPEPSLLSLALVGGLVWFWRKNRRR